MLIFCKNQSTDCKSGLFKSLFYIIHLILVLISSSVKAGLLTPLL